MKRAVAREIKRLEKADARLCAKNLEFEKAAAARDDLFRLRERVFGAAQTRPLRRRVENELIASCWYAWATYADHQPPKAFFRHFIKINGLGDKVEVDSAGTHGYHVGEAPDSADPACGVSPRIQPVATAAPAR